MFNRIIFQIWRPTVTTGHKKDLQNTGAKITVEVEPVDREVSALAGAVFGKSYTGFSRDLSVSIAEGDRLINDSDSTDEYDVRGVQKFNHPPKHYEISLEQAIKT